MSAHADTTRTRSDWLCKRRHFPGDNSFSKHFGQAISNVIMSNSENDLEHACSLAADSPPDQLIAEMSNEEHEPLLTAWPGLPHTNTQISFSTARSNLMLERRKLGLKLLLSHSTNLPSPCFQHSALPLSRNLPSYLLAHPPPPPRLHRTLQYIRQSPSLPPGRASCRHLHAPYLHHRAASPRVQRGWSCGGLRGSWMAVQHRCRERG